MNYTLGCINLYNIDRSKEIKDDKLNIVRNTFVEWIQAHR